MAAPTSAGATSSGGRLPKGHVILRDRISPLASPVPANWLAAFNYYRNLATPNLPDVVENVGVPNDNYSYWDRWHSTYMVETQDGIDHQENQDTPLHAQWYHPNGHDSAQNSNLAWTSDIKANAVWAIEGWMTAPFHGLQMLDPRLQETGWGLKHKSGVQFKTAAGVDVSHDDDNVPDPAIVYPVMFPGVNKTVYLDRYGQSEQPNPFGQGPCTYLDGDPADPAAHTGPPIYLFFGPGGSTVEFDPDNSSFRQGTNVLPFCGFDGGDYGGPHGLGMQDLNAIFLFPEKPLKSEKQYTATIDTVAGDPVVWSFRTGDLVAPTSRIKKPAHQATVDQDNLSRLVGISGGDTTRVDVAIAHVRNGRCRFMSANGNLGSQRNCFSQTWHKANGKTDWAFPLPRKLPASFNPFTGQQDGFYYAFSRGRDEVANIETKFTFGRNYIAFHVTP